MVTWQFSATLVDADGHPFSFASEVEFYQVVDEVLTVRTVGLETRVVEGRCLGFMAIPKPGGIRTVEELAARTLEELPPG